MGVIPTKLCDVVDTNIIYSAMRGFHWFQGTLTMQNNIPPSGWWEPILFFLQQNSLAIKGAFTAFFTALLFSLWDGETWRRSINAGLICFIVSAAVVSAMHQLGLSDQDWSFIIGATVGGIGVDRCRAFAVSIVSYIADQKGIKRNDKR